MSDDRPTFGSLFAGIGGFDLGLERAGWRGRWQVEYEPFCQRVLAKHWPDVHRVGDIHDAHGVWDCPVANTPLDRRGPGWQGRSDTGGAWEPEQPLPCPNCLEPVDLIAGGFPCQPFSNAGKRLGKADARWLWPEFARAVGALRPRYVLVENVPGLLAGHGGMGAVLGDLAALGYDAEWDSIPASAVGAPHLRYRVWIVAHVQAQSPEQSQGIDATASVGVGAGAGRGGSIWHPAERVHGLERGPSQGPDVAHTDRVGPRRQAEMGQASLTGPRPQGAGAEPHGAGAGAMADPYQPRPQGRQVQPERPDQRPAGAGGLADADTVRWDGRSGFFGEGWRRQLADGRGWLPEPDVGRVAHGVPDRVHRLSALGNAVVPQVVEAIGRRIIEAEGLR